jgi:hypothetical protein
MRENEGLRFVGFTILGVVCLAGGFLGLLASHTADGRTESAAAMALGLAGVMVARMFAPRRKRRPPRTTTLETDAGSVPAVEIAISTDRLRAAVGGTAAFMLAGIAFVASGRLLAGGFATAVFGVATLLGLRNLARGSAVYLTETAIVSRSGMGELELAWDDVAGVSEVSVSGSRLGIVTGVEPPTVRSGRSVRLFNRLTRGSFGDLSIALDLVDADAETLLDEIMRLAEDSGERAGIATGAVARRLGGDAKLTPASRR